MSRTKLEMCAQNAVDLFFFFLFKIIQFSYIVELNALVCFKRLSPFRGLWREQCSGCCTSFGKMRATPPGARHANSGPVRWAAQLARHSPSGWGKLFKSLLF